MERSELEALGLWNPQAEHAAERLMLLEYLLELGATVDDLLDAGDELPVLASTIGLRSGRERLTLHEVAERAGVQPELVERVFRASGFPDTPPGARVFSEADAEVLQTLAVGVDLMGETATFELIRVIGSSMARVGDAVVSAFVTNVLPEAIAADPVGLELARANANAVSLLPALMRAMEVVLRRHLEYLRRPIPAADEDLRGFETQRVAVGFADLVGSSVLTHQLSTGELGRMFAAFDAQASDAVTAAGGRVVKLIGDAVMFVAPTAAIACDIALGLAESFADHQVLPPVRCGIALGTVLARDGDYYGAVVNLAARACGAAGPGEVLVSGPVRDQLADSVTAPRLDPIGPTKLKGFDEPVELFELEQAARGGPRRG